MRNSPLLPHYTKENDGAICRKCCNPFSSIHTVSVCLIFSKASWLHVPGHHHPNIYFNLQQELTLKVKDCAFNPLLVIIRPRLLWCYETNKFVAEIVLLRQYIHKYIFVAVNPLPHRPFLQADSHEQMCSCGPGPLTMLHFYPHTSGYFSELPEDDYYCLSLFQIKSRRSEHLQEPPVTKYIVWPFYVIAGICFEINYFLKHCCENTCYVHVLSAMQQTVVLSLL